MRGDCPGGVPRLPQEVYIGYWDGSKRRNMAAVLGMGKEGVRAGAVGAVLGS